MLSKLRDYSSYFLWFVVVTFVGFMAFSGVGECVTSPAQRGVLAEVNGQEITRQTFNLAVSRATQNRQAQSQEELSDQDIAQIRDQTWQQLLGALLIEQEANRRQLRVTDEELANFLRQYPPDDIRQLPAFQTDGNFDYSRYLSAMTNTDPQWTNFWTSVEAYWRPQLRQSKLQQQVISTVRVNDAELEDYFHKTNDQARVEFLMVRASPYNDEVGTPTEEQLQALYDEEKWRYRRFERVMMNMAIWSRMPSQADRDWAREQLVDVQQQIADGADFAELAEQYTMDPTGTSTGGDLGWFGRGAMVKAFEDAAYALDIGAVSEPVETQFGFHLIKLEDKRPAADDEDEFEVRARHILITAEVSQQTVDSLVRAAEDFAIAVREGALEFTEAVVTERGGLWYQPRGTQRNDNLPFVGSAPDVKAWAFGAEPGAICDPIDDGGKLVVAQLQERREAGIAGLDEVESQVQSRWIALQARESARPQADSLMALALDGAVMRELAAGDNVTLTTTGLFSRSTNVAQVGRSPLFMGTVFTMTEDDPWSDLIPLESGWALIHLLEMQKADVAELAGVRDSVAAQILQTKQNAAFSQWVSDLYLAADILDYRVELYGSM